MIRIDGYLIDAAISEEPSLESEVTEYPVESGATISDHVRNLPLTLELEFTVSDTPIGQAATARAAGAVPSSEARQFLETLRASRRPFSVVTARRTYESMIFTSLAFPRDGETGDALVGRASLQHFEIVNVRRVAVELQQKKNLGRRQSRTVPGGTLWLCPEGVTVSDDSAANKRNRCRKVITKVQPSADGFGVRYLVYADTGERLTSAESVRLARQQFQATGFGKAITDPNLTWSEGRGEFVDRRTGVPPGKTPTARDLATNFLNVPPDYKPPEPIPYRADRDPMDLAYYRRATGL
jgi:hypothetical protein